MDFKKVYARLLRTFVGFVGIIEKKRSRNYTWENSRVMVRVRVRVRVRG